MSGEFKSLAERVALLPVQSASCVLCVFLFVVSLLFFGVILLDEEEAYVSGMSV